MSKREKMLPIFLITLVSIAGFLVIYFYFTKISSLAEEKNQLPIATEQTDNWKRYRNDKYGFSLNYPDTWAQPREENGSKENNYVLKVSLGTEEGQKGSNVDGFYVFVYPSDVCLGGIPSSGSSGKSYNVSDANNLAEFIANQAKKSSSCVSKRISVKGDVLPEEVNIYQLAGADYNYLITPFMDKNNKASDKFKTQWINVLKSFLLNSPKLKRPDSSEAKMKKPNVIFATLDLKKPKIELVASYLETKNLPVQYAPKNFSRQVYNPNQEYFLSGICRHPGRKPEYSKTKGDHVDEDCCPDPDEWPNPSCHYSASGYNVLLRISRR